jgi:hypothetical protein
VSAIVVEILSTNFIGFIGKTKFYLGDPVAVHGVYYLAVTMQFGVRPSSSPLPLWDGLMGCSPWILFIEKNFHLIEFCELPRLSRRLLPLPKRQGTGAVHNLAESLWHRSIAKRLGVR